MAAKRRKMTTPTGVLAAFRNQLQSYVLAEFEDNQSRAGKALGIDQSHLSSLLSGKKGPGIPLLLKLRERTGRSIDEWLGLQPTMDAVRAVVREELAKR
jgi:plasmid maintenance system antidote protein VapI